MGISKESRCVEEILAVYYLTASLTAFILFMQKVLYEVIDFTADFGGIVAMLRISTTKFSISSSPGQPLLPFGQPLQFCQQLILLCRQLLLLFRQPLLLCQQPLLTFPLRSHLLLHRLKVPLFYQQLQLIPHSHHQRLKYRI